MRRSKYTIAFHKLFGDDITTKPQISKITGIPIRILDAVYDRGMAAWLISHRPNVEQHQWAQARLYSFLMLGKTHYTTDSDLAREAKLIPKARRYFQLVESLN